jgi:FAD/FMN-containing dehydrogenase
MVAPGDENGITRAHAAERALMEPSRRTTPSISGEHGIGYKKLPFIGIELSAEEIALMKRVKAAFDPYGLLNPGKIFPS